MFKEVFKRRKCERNVPVKLRIKPHPLKTNKNAACCHIYFDKTTEILHVI